MVEHERLLPGSQQPNFPTPKWCFAAVMEEGSHPGMLLGWRSPKDLVVEGVRQLRPLRFANVASERRSFALGRQRGFTEPAELSSCVFTLLQEQS